MKKGIDCSMRILKGFNRQCVGVSRTKRSSRLYCCYSLDSECCSSRTLTTSTTGRSSIKALSLLQPATIRTCNFHSARLMPSKSPTDGSNSDIQMDDTKPLTLTSLSDDDLKLAIQAANEDQGLSAKTNSSINIDQIPGTSKGGSRKLAIIFTCTVCNTRSAKKFTEQAYNHGVVLIRCPKCENLHLIADRLGYFGDKNDGDGKGWDIETFMKSIGQEDDIKVATEGQEVFEVTLKDVLGDKMHESLEEEPEEGKKFD